MKNDIRYFDSPNIKSMQHVPLGNERSIFHCETYLFDCYFRKSHITESCSGFFNKYLLEYYHKFKIKHPEII